MLIVSGLEETAPDCLQHIVLYNVSFLSLSDYFFFSSFLCCMSFPPLPFKTFLLRHSPSI